MPQDLRSSFNSPDSTSLRNRVRLAVPVRDLAVIRVAVGVLVVVAGLLVWVFGGSGGAQSRPPEETLSRATTTTSMVSEPSKEVVVQVAGAVLEPGVVTLAEGARVSGAVEAAGGLAPDADMDRINLAARIVDGERIYVVRRGEKVAPDVVGANGAASSGTDGAAPDGTININTATEKTLEELPGVGPATAKAIVDYRTKSGPFASVQDLSKVKGIGPAKLAQIEPVARV